METKRGDNLTLIGMPGSGKSTVGRLVAERLEWPFVDVDADIERAAGMKLWQINEAEGFDGLRRREAEANLALRPDRPTVIAPGGSVIYSEAAMRHLRSLGRVIYLHVPARVLEGRAGDLRLRGVMIQPGMTYADLIAERDPLYQQWADEVVECGAATVREIAGRVCALDGPRE